MIVTRFAPSPTGYLHIGSARTALFNWLMARRNGGKFILRIEDTDLKRNTPTATEQLIRDLGWLGFDWDEGPDVGGPNGPYLQSQRLDLYNPHIQKLIDEGKAYYCFDTPEEIDSLRKQAIAQKKNFIYPRPSRFPDSNDLQEAKEQGKPISVRFVMPDESITVSDLVRGQVNFESSQISDFIIQKSDGYPTYHLACVIDDQLMKVTHVIRGQEHLMNTPHHMLLQQALGFDTPIYAHMSVTLSEDGGKLSKRQRAITLAKVIQQTPEIDKQKLAATANLTGDQFDAFLKGKVTLDPELVSTLAKQIKCRLPEINVIDFYKSGFVPEALVNFIALLGWSTGDDKEIMTVAELTSLFDLERLNKSNSLFDHKKLIAFNTEHMKMLDPDTLLGHFKNYLQTNRSPLGDFSDEILMHILRACQGARSLADIESKSRFLYTDEIEFDPKAVKKVLQKENAPQNLDQARAALTDLDDWSPQSLHDAVEQLCQKHNLSMGKIAQPLRVAITGTTISPPIHDSLALLGKEKTLQRIDNTLAYLHQQESGD
ncbi:MAG: glutamate--tRNA ligase [Planctomycetes bacterium]|nr:glutamate--tRNA ligase [Planctomycetota bacterium]